MHDASLVGERPFGTLDAFDAAVRPVDEASLSAEVRAGCLRRDVTSLKRPLEETEA